MFQKIIAFIMSIIAFFASLFSGGSTYRSFTNVSYGTDSRNVMDLYIPKGEGNYGLVLFIHGGAWIAGDKSAYTDAAEYTCESLGVATMTISYRYISETVDVFDILDDITAALNKACEIAASKNCSFTKLMTTGHSAGGHLSMLYAYSRQSESPVPIACVADYSGPVNLANSEYYGDASALAANTDVYALMSKACGKAFTKDTFLSASTALLSASPISYISSAVPTIISHGMKDDIVPYSDAVALKEALTAAGVKNDFVSYPNSGHDLADDSSCADATYELAVEYINTYLK